MNNYFAAIIRGHKRRNAYRSLLLLDDHLLEDIGLTKSHLDLLIDGDAQRNASRKSNGHE
jgi:hypothetical protein